MNRSRRRRTFQGLRQSSWIWLLPCLSGRPLPFRRSFVAGWLLLPAVLGVLAQVLGARYGIVAGLVASVVFAAIGIAGVTMESRSRPRVPLKKCGWVWQFYPLCLPLFNWF